MRRSWLIVVVGVLVVLVGVVWTLQGLNIIGGSGMSGNRTFVVVGPIVGVVGLLLLGLSLRRQMRRA